MEGRFLTIELPVGRKLYYDSPEVSGIDGSCSFMGQNQYTNQWERGTTWGGKLVENQAQAIARDVLAHGLLTYSKGGGTIIGHVHDEAIAEECTEHAQTALAYMNQCLSTTPSWLPGIVLGAEGYIAKRYRKD
jgi:DNA polymerase